MIEKKTMMDYINETASVLAANIERRGDLTERLVAEYVEGGYKNIIIVASGSSNNGSQMARSFVRNALGVEVKILSPFNFIAAENDFGPTDFVVTISQSGASTNSIDALKLIKSKNAKAIGITGNMDSDFKDYADLLIDYGVGEETVHYITKGVPSLALFLMLFAVEAGVKKGTLAQDKADALIGELSKVPDAFEKVKEAGFKFYEENFKALSSLAPTFMCSVGANMGAALEAALKLTETLHIPAFAYESEEYLHGPNLQLTPDYRLFFIDGGKASGRIYETFEASAVVSDKVFLITANEGYKGKNVFFLPLDIEESVSPLAWIALFQILAYKLTDDLGRWQRHPLVKILLDKTATKTENYKND